jgi:electron transport complex protein RnfG
MTAKEQTQAPLEAMPSSGAMIRTLGLVAALSGFLVVLAYQITLPIITTNKRQAVQRAVFNVVPGAASQTRFIVTDKGIQPAGKNAPKGTPIYAGYDEKGQLIGIAAEAAAPGYADIVRVLYGYSAACQCITGISILDSKETPGLGDRIGTDPEFLANFNKLDASLNEPATALKHAIVTVKHGSKTHPWQIDAISGATISSTAVGKMLNQSAQHLLPRLLPHIKEIQVKH